MHTDICASYIYIRTYIHLQHTTFTVVEHNAVDDSKKEVSQEEHSSTIEYDDVLVENKANHVSVQCLRFTFVVHLHIYITTYVHNIMCNTV